MSTKDRLEGIATAIFGRREATAEPPEGTPTIAQDATAETPTTGQPTSPLTSLDLDTAIRLRWALRDIKAKRIKLTPVSAEDLIVLVENGLIEMRNDGRPSSAGPIAHRIIDPWRKD